MTQRTHTNLEKKIKKLVRDKNLQKLFDLVDGELTSGPRKNFVKGKKFSEIFFR